MTDQDYADDNAGRLERIAVALEKLADCRPVLPLLEDVIAWIQVRADRLPEPVREPEIELDPPTKAVFE